MGEEGVEERKAIFSAEAGELFAVFITCEIDVVVFFFAKVGVLHGPD